MSFKACASAAASVNTVVRTGIDSTFVANSFEEEIIGRLGEESRDRVLQLIVDEEGETNGIVRKGIGDLRKLTKPAWADAYKFGRTARGLDMNDWKGSNVTVMLCGGGGQLAHAEEIFGEPLLKWQEGVDFPNNPTMYLPCPNGRYDETTGAPFYRMSVAYGLTNQELFKWDIDPDSWDLPKPKKAIERGDYDGDDLIPNSSWLGGR